MRIISICLKGNKAMNTQFTDNEAASRFEWVENGHTTFAAYKIEGGVLYINHVEAPEPLRGTGAAGRLMEQIVAFSKAQHYTIHPICGYAASWMRRHPA